MQQLSSLIQKSLNGTATAAELKELLVLLDEQQHHLYSEWMKGEYNDEVDHMPAAFDQQAMKALFNSRIQASAPVPIIRLNPYRKLLAYSRPVAAAAMVILLLVSLVFFFRTRKQSARPEPLAQTETFSTMVEAGDEQRTVLLKDSSVVLLYAGSSLRYDTGYNVRSRQLFLKGRAQFSVKKQQEKPFTVTNKHLTTTALGTVFEVQESADSTIVSLLEGKVSVQHFSAGAGETVYLLPGQRAIGFNNAALAIRLVNREPTTSIGKKVLNSVNEQPQQLLFRQMPLIKVFDILQKKYKTNIRFDRKDMAGILFTGSFEANEPIGPILEMIGTINNLDILSGPEGYTVKK